MLKWKRNKHGGSHPEGLDRIDSAARIQSHRTNSLREVSLDSPKLLSRRKNLFTRSFCEGDVNDRISFNDNDLSSQKKNAVLRPLVIGQSANKTLVSPSPFENLSLDDLWKDFDIAHKEISLISTPSPQGEGCNDIFIVTPNSKSRQNSRQDRHSPTCLPCIEEGVENDELASIADSGICDDDDYDLDNRNKQQAKHYFEPLKFHGDRMANCGDELSPSPSSSRKTSPCSPDQNKTFSPSSLNSPVDRPLTENDIEASFKRNNIHRNFNNNSCGDESEHTSSNETSSLENVASFDNSDVESIRSCSPVSDIDSKTNNQKGFSRLKLKAADLTSSSPPSSSSSCSSGTNSPKSTVPHSLISSMLWNGSTSDHPPSSTGIYSTMPPNRYGQRNKDFMSQLSETSSPSMSPTSSPSLDKKAASPKEFKVSLDVSHYGPDEILVTLEDGKLVVNGKHFSDSEYGFESLQFHRRYPIPNGIKKDDIKSTITDDGILIITGRVSEAVELQPRSDSRLSQCDNVQSPRLKRTSSPRLSLKNPNRSTSEMFLNSGNNRITSPTLSRRSLPTSDYSEDSRSRLSEDSNMSENEFLETEEDTFLLKVNCKGYDPQDLDLKIQSRELIIHGRQKICSMEDGHERIRHKEFTKRYSVPRNANCHQIMSRFTEDEQLVVEIRRGGSIKQGVVREDILDDE